ncbi:hypothetical protein J2W25_002294 [Variovorax boronicumulans]|uniref:Uncharacterized protein n=1 Tax=Variovorax boronicumulans TaxID=436515 RepID=A0AAW8DUV8_9BURK|nr:hypothetical protein [Variovorax boronicumulans]MDP9877990.1 hypothetical protein [Variovorax boronicumulans]MDP9923273.1 hypothetical protein [Variovorax boronicumulans]
MQQAPCVPVPSQPDDSSRGTASIFHPAAHLSEQGCCDEPSHTSSTSAWLWAVAARKWGAPIDENETTGQTEGLTWIRGQHTPRRRRCALAHQSLANLESTLKNQDRFFEHRAPNTQGLHTASLGSSQAPTDAVHNPAVLAAQA